VHTLVVTPQLPLPGDAATARLRHLLRLLRELGCDVDLLWLASPQTTAAHAHAAESLGLRVQKITARPQRRLGAGGRTTPDPQPELTAAASELIDKVSLVVCDGALMHVHVRDLLWPMDRPPFCLIDLGEPASARLVTQAKSASAWQAWKLRAEAEAMRGVEAAAAYQADLVLVSNQVDLEMLAERASDANLWLIADGIDVNPEAATSRPECEGVLLAADLSQAAHQRAADWFVRAVMPLVTREREEAVLHVVGPRLPRSLRRAMRDGVLQWHAVEPGADAIRAVATRCAVCVAPERQARGAATTVLHAMAVGRPVVCTHTVATTLPMETGTAPVVADRAEDLAAALVRLLHDPREAALRGEQGRRLAETHATWSAQWSRVGALLAELAARQSPRIVSDLPQLRSRPAPTAAVP
jgi:hypothetical protein